ncbi:MAG: EamA family transporter RarD [Eggerthellaceae bacterium]|nr:EamA family transporter RarD [Eggerthellaceae bacterium]
MSNTNQSSQELKGTLAGLLCYVIWGLAPLYWKLLDNVNSFEVIGQRIIWCFVLMVIICAVMRINFLELLRDKRAVSFLLPAAVLISINWGVYIYAVDTERVVHTAMGYYCNPLFSILFGVLFFKERLTTIQKIAVGLCLIGVIYFLFDYGELPWISLVLAISFGAYGAVKKKGGYPAVPALAVESALALPLAFGVAIAAAYITGSHAFLGDTHTVDGWILTLLVIGAGPITAIPLVLFAKAANSIPLSLLGFIQYVSPTIALLLGVFAFGEPFTSAHAVCFGCIWAGLALVSFGTLRGSKKTAQPTLEDEQHA